MCLRMSNMLWTRKNFKDEKNLEKNVKKSIYKNATQRVLEPALLNHVAQRLYPLHQGCSLQLRHQKLYLNPNPDPNPNPNPILGD